MLTNKRLVAVCAIFFCFNVAYLTVFVKMSRYEKCYVTINKHQEVTVHLPEKFLSFGIDVSEIQNFDKIDFNKTKLRDLASALAPARLRLGGTMTDRLIFSRDDEPLSCAHCERESYSKSVCHSVKKLCEHKFLPFFVMTGNKWTEINEFCKATHLKLLFSFNVLLRDDHGWNEKNAKDLLEYSKFKNFDIDWQLGNEPNSFRHVFNITVNPQMLAHDFEKLHKLLSHIGYRHSLLVGPDTTRPQSEHPECLEYMEQFLGNVSHYVKVRSWHQYYLNGRTSTIDDFWNPATFELLREQIEVMQNHTKKFINMPMWLTETSSAYGGGAPGLSDSFSSSPLWLDKLGLAAKYNITTVVRQSFIGANYSLVTDDLEPLPDWWISVLYKKLVGQKVLNIDCHCSPYQRMYAHCANRNYTSDRTAITIFAVNLEMAKARFLLNGTALHQDSVKIDEFIISAPSNNRLTKTVLLNGWPLYYEDAMPDLKPMPLKYGKHISMPPYSIGFWVIKNTSIEACK